MLKLIACVTITIFSGCDGFVETELPNSQLTSDSVFEDKATATAAMTDIYSRLRESGLFTGRITGIGSELGHYADELVYYGDISNPVPEFYNNNLTPGNGGLQEIWNSSYGQIYACNAVIEGVTHSKTLVLEDRRQLIGEALFTRALVHFYLAGVFGDIPYVTHTDYRQNSLVRRLPVFEVYDRVIADLEAASDLLPAAYVAEGRVRPNLYTVYALLARVNLYKGEWLEACIMSTAVIDHSGLYSLTPNLNDVFLKDSPSTIWQLMPSPGKNTDEALTFIFSEGPPPNTALSPNIVAAFESADGRRSSWIGSVTDGSNTWHYANKYKADGNVAASVEYPILFRIEELYLIRAEASATIGLTLEARADLNTIRNRAGLPNTTATTSEAIVDAVINERRFEFFTEYGHRFFDLKRTGNLDAVLGGVKPGWNTADRLWPIPQTELQANPNLRPQNAGY